LVKIWGDLNLFCLQKLLLHGVCGSINILPLDIFKVLIEMNGCDVNVQNNPNILHFMMHFVASKRIVGISLY
jgi:hypothetical protein